MDGLQIVSLGRGVPERRVTNQEFETLIDTNDAWIVSHTGIQERRFVQGETNCQLATMAAREAIERAGIALEEIVVCIVATFSPDHFTPSVSCGVAGTLGMPQSTLCFDLNAACSGFIYGLNVAQRLLAATPDKYALVVGSEVLSRLLDMTDRGTCVLFGDGAGAAVVRLSADHPFWFTGGCRPDVKVLGCPAFHPAIYMDGQPVYRFATEIIPKCVNQLLDQAGITLDAVDTVVCHQANSRIIETAAKRLGADIGKFFMNLQHYGNTSAASIPLALYELEAKAGSRVLCVGFGAGLTYGGALLTI